MERINPKEKAKELIETFSLNPANVGFIHKGKAKASSGELSRTDVKKQALKCVNEIINCDSFFKTLEDAKEFISYWYEVQEEINKY